MADLDTYGVVLPSFARSHDLLDGLRTITRRASVRYCGLTLLSDVESPLPEEFERMGATLWRSGMRSEDGPRAWASGVMRCSAAGVCPVCASRIAATRAEQLSKSIGAWQANGGELLHIVLTVPHTRRDPLRPQLDGIRTAWRTMTSARRWATLREAYGMKMVHRSTGEPCTKMPTVRALEITHGENGWHAHYHVALAVGRVLSPDEFADIRTKVGEWWRKAVLKELGRHVNELGALHFGRNHDALGSYVIKVSSLGAEVVLASGKKAAGESRTPWDLALDAVEGDRRAHRLWSSYERAMHRQRVVTGIGEFVTLTNDLPVQKSAEAVETPPPDDDRELVCDLTREEWRAIGGWLDGRARIGKALAAASRGNAAFVRWFEDEFGTTPRYGEGGGWSGPPPPHVIDASWWIERRHLVWEASEHDRGATQRSGRRSERRRHEVPRSVGVPA